MQVRAEIIGNLRSRSTFSCPPSVSADNVLIQVCETLLKLYLFISYSFLVVTFNVKVPCPFMFYVHLSKQFCHIPT